jgi:Matrixin
LKKIIAFVFSIPIIGIHGWLLFNAIVFICTYFKRLLIPLKNSNRMIVLLAYQDTTDLNLLEKQWAFLYPTFAAFGIQVTAEWVKLDTSYNFNKDKAAGRFFNLFYTEIYFIYAKYLYALLKLKKELLISRQGVIIASVHHTFYGNDKIQVVGFSRGFPFSHVIIAKNAGAHVLAHEIGHSCGLWHSKEKNNLMYALTPQTPVILNEKQLRAVFKARYIFN